MEEGMQRPNRRHRGEGLQRPNWRAWRRGCRAKIGVHRGEGCSAEAKIGVQGGDGMQRPNRHAQRGDAEAKSACMEEGMQRPNRHAWRRCRGQIGVHGGEGMQEAKFGVHREGIRGQNRLAWSRGDAEAKSVCMEERGRRGKSACTEPSPEKGQAYIQSSVEPQARPRCGLRPFMSRFPLVAIIPTVSPLLYYK
ncbi:hypothetical protein B0H14DRAFT_2624847 [Mycena olivaceomarginata]|nr:hypothetical protein B0H14DRAFT_2624847 [Mycena olivaceomarginata]